MPERADPGYRGAIPDASGHFGRYGGKFVPETLMAALEELEQVYLKAKADPTFESEMQGYLR
ncbi:MAG: tryptophan synthase subunit beta, partial [candidate division NC10 bacterium]